MSVSSLCLDCWSRADGSIPRYRELLGEHDEFRPVIDDRGVRVFSGDCIDVLRTLPDASVDSIVTDPPYGLVDLKPARVAAAVTAWLSGDRERVPDGKGFMGRTWDGFVPPPAVWDECLRVLKPGGHVLAFAGSRTQDLMGLSIRLAGFELRDSIAWLYGSGFPKSLDVSKAIDKAAGAEREVIGTRRGAGIGGSSTTFAQDSWTESMRGPQELAITEPATDAARQWAGWGTALKPGHEPAVVARKPLDGTVAANVLAHGTGALNIDACRTAMSDEDREAAAAGRWPANVALDEAAAAALDAQSGTLRSGLYKPEHADNGKAAGTYGAMQGRERATATYGDEGGASRFFYCAKAPNRERPKVDGVSHPTVKPLDLMRWLVRLVTPPEVNGRPGVVLDPFAGSGTTLQAARDEGFTALGVESEPTYLPLIAARLDAPITPTTAVASPTGA